jgi:predicted AAA+ superfamily ATPase
LDEIQFVGKKKIQDDPEIIITFYDVLNGLAQNSNYDIYVTGSNSKMLSTDIATEFRGRGDVLKISPLSYREIYDFKGGDRVALFDEYLLFGGLPLVLTKKSDEEKKEYLTSLFSETYFKDILERFRISYPEVLELITSNLCSSVGSLTNTTKIANTLLSVKKIKVDSETVASYLKYLTDSYLFSVAQRYDVKGKRYFSYPNKYYCVDSGLNNARLNFRQIEETHLMENIVYNELRSKGYSVDVGVVESSERTETGGVTKVSREIDFVVNADKVGKKCYVQCALSIDEPEKERQELLPFMKLGNDFNRRIIITKTGIKPWTDENGILHIGIYDFLLNEDQTL